MLASLRVAAGIRSVTAADAAAYAAALRRVVPLDADDVRAGLDLVRVRELARGEHVLRGGERATDVIVVVHGLLREYFVLPDGTERTKAFIAEGELSGSLADLLVDAPSRAFIVAEEPSRLLVARYTAYRELARRLPAWDRLGRIALERLLVRKADREYELLALDAEARYAELARRYPGLEARVAARHVASYVGITPVHLSRLRRRRLHARRERRAPGS
jgi:CRP-like cAMP-binding protein